MKSFFLILLLVPFTAIAADSTALKNALASTESWLQTSGEGKTWIGYLRFADLRSEMAKAKPSVSELKLILNKWRKNKVGLEDPRFVVSQKALRAFIHQVEIEAIADRTAACSQWKAKIAETPKNQSEASEVGKAAGWLESACGDKASADKLRAAYNRSNLRFSVSAKSIAMGLEGMEIHNQQFARNTVQGVATRGWVYTDGTISAQPAQARYIGQGIVEIRLNAHINSPRIDGNKGKVQIVTSSQGNAWANAQLGVDASGIKVLSANASGALGTQILDVYHPSILINWIAWRQAQKKQGEASATASQMAATKLRDELVSQLTTKLNEAKAKFLEPFQQTVRFQNAYPKVLDFSSDPGQLRLAVTEQNAFQLAAPNDPPALAGKHDISLSVHESFAGNYFAPYMGAKQEWDTSLYDVHKLLTTDEPPELRVHDNAPRWYFWVDEYRPMVADFDDNNVRLRFHGTSIGRVWKGVEEKNSRPFELTVDYTPEIDTVRNQARLRRVGVATVLYTDGLESTALDTSLQDMMTAKANAFFPELFEFGGLQIPKGSGWEKLRRFKLKEFKSASGWMALGFELN